MVVAASRARSQQFLSDKREDQGGRPEARTLASVSSGEEPGGKRKTVAQLFGEIVWLFTQSPQHQSFQLADLEWLIMTPVLLRQFKVFYTPERPVGVALWAFVGPEVEQCLLSGRARLAPADWKSGEKPWLVEVVAPFGQPDAMIMSLKRSVFSNRRLAYLGLEGERLAIKTL